MYVLMLKYIYLKQRARIQFSLPETKGEWQHLNLNREWGNPGLSNSFL